MLTYLYIFKFQASAQASLVVDEFTEKDETGLEDETECHEVETGNERPAKKFAQEKMLQAN